jgi:hypothetical protein
MVVLPATGASRYHNWFVDGGSSPESFGYPFLHEISTRITDISSFRIVSQFFFSSCIAITFKEDFVLISVKTSYPKLSESLRA